MKILFYTDPHNCDTPPRMRKASYTEDILDKQEQLIPIAQSCDLVICGGDIFHQKKAGRVSYQLTRKLMDIYSEFGHMYIIPGNHDFELNIDEVFSKSPIMMFEQLSNVEILHQKTLEWDETIICGFGGGDYYDARTLLRVTEKCKEYYGAKKKGKIGVFHSSVTHEQQPYDIIPADRFLDTFDALCLGHIHDVQRVDHSIIAPGALSRGVLRLDASMEREVGCAVFEVGVNGITSFEFIKLDYKIPQDAFYLERKLSEKEIENASAKLIEFVDSMDVPKALTEDDLIEYIEDMDGLDSTVKQQALRLLRSM